jgi:hypothetical protein
MDDPLEIKPRFHEPDAPIQQNNQPQGYSLSNGLFTSLYDNKIIVLMIIIVIIIIGIGAYIIYRKPDPEPVKNNKKPSNAQNTQSAAQNTSSTAQTSAQPNPKTADSVATESQNNRADLLKLLEKTKQNNTEQPVTANKTTKSDSEIMQLMEDTSNDTKKDSESETEAAV